MVVGRVVSNRFTRSRSWRWPRRRPTSLRTALWPAAGLSALCSGQSVWSCRSPPRPSGESATPLWRCSPGLTPSASETCSKTSDFNSSKDPELKEERLQPDFSFCLYVLWLQLVKIRNPGSRKFRLCVLSERTLNLQVDKGAGSSAGIGTGCRFHLLTVPNTIK